MDDVIPDDYLNADGVILRNTNPVRTASGQFPENYQPLASIRMRRPYAPNASETAMAERLQATVTHISYVKPDVDVKSRDRMTCEGVTYQVTAVLDPSLKHHRKVMLDNRTHGSTV